MVSGTAAGIGRELGIDPIYVRVAFVVLAVAGGWGVIAYAFAWYALHRRTTADADEPYVPIPKASTPRMRHVAFAMVVAGLVLLTSGFGGAFSPALVWPVALVGAAAAVALDRGYVDRTGGRTTERDVQMRLGLGFLLLLAGVIAAFALNFTFWQAVRSIMVAGLVVAGAGLLLAPMLTEMADELFAERRRRIRSEERADMAAHLHDSVLQTLALIQKRSDDVGVVNLARRQERELRSWLFDDASDEQSQGFRSRLERVMAEVEDLHELPIEVVVVGDRPTGVEVDPLLKASREAATNAARHAGAPRIDVFAEVRPDRIEVFVRDQGAGFDPDQVGDDRAGIRDSILRRMERHGGTAHVFSRPGHGTEVELMLPLDEPESADVTFPNGGDLA